ncbi:MAG TPA: tripartite tricarboxylate transporter substrate-binding protein [Alphaproteobacteria bacterium]|nr:tripartite tricarboxylate transporter substrate-binding protein [Alphaproteobacteria bacterium]
MRAAILRSIFLSGISLGLITGAASAQQVTERKYDAKAVEAFYKGKQVDVFIGSEASGGYNAYARIVGQHFAKHIPGEPVLVYRNMPGASGLVMASSLYNKAPKDGSAIGIVHNTIVIEPLLGRKVQYEADKFEWLGSANQLTSTCVVSDKSPVQTLDQAREKEILIGGSGATSSSTFIVGAFLNTLAGTKFKIIRGYPSTMSVQLAMERGEVDGLCGVGWDSLLASSQARLEDKSLKVLVQVNIEPIDDLKGVPSALDYAISPEAKETMEFLISRQYIGRPFVAPPGTPADRVAALRTAFEKTMTDPAFIADAKKSQLEVNWISGEKAQAHVAKMLATPQKVQDAANDATQLKGGVIQANLKWLTAKGVELTAVQRGSIGFTYEGKPVKANLDDTKITVAGAEAKADALKAGQKCDVVFLGNNDVAQSIACP